ncbi:MAG TPA: type II toxin-antitoxin system RelE/ParE family toxin [Oscillatoriaceae cyanobacterium M33_DOE_052]|uniref:Type II toxin-antitoxin system RelE/ParE family toxin n=1 Tax=Planktothricoides sp. SpSt-374 TaxID=2282167 RepID=A0A7C3VKJ4_9CYAN|nr:type II toxin-antitoxin system RelE/ParE family toxin [Oscillatoriaceae cyanobacterium M33_DOE_052]
MSNDQPLVQIDLTPQYKRNLRDLAKKYRRIRLDTQPIIEELQQGNFTGDGFADLSVRLAGMGENYLIFKVRVKNTDIQKGKSGGYQLIYQVESPTSVLLLTIYAKSEVADISVNEINSILAELYFQ